MTHTTTRDELVEAMARAISIADHKRCPDGFADGYPDDLSDWDVYIATAILPIIEAHKAASGEPVAWLYTDEEGGRVSCVEQIEPPFVNWTETPLYRHPPTKAVRDAAIAEVVAWLRKEPLNMLGPQQPSALADAIASGEWEAGE